MGSLYAGDDTNFPNQYTIPDDADPPHAGVLNVAFEALGDRTAWLRRVTVRPGANFPVRVDSNQLATHIKYSPTQRRWFGSSQGGTDRFQTTRDPFTWGAASEIGGLNILTQTVWDFALDASGNMIAASQNFDHFWKRAAAGVWSTQSGAIGYDFDRPAIVYDARCTRCGASRSRRTRARRARSASSRARTA